MLETFGIQHDVSCSSRNIYCNVHLQDEQNVQVHHNDTHAERIEAARQITSDLLKYFGRPQSCDFDHLTLLQCYDKYTIGGRGGTVLKDKYRNTVKHREVSSTNHVARIASKHQTKAMYFICVCCYTARLPERLNNCAQSTVLLFTTLVVLRPLF